jgi:hypothetical protein
VSAGGRKRERGRSRSNERTDYAMFINRSDADERGGKTRKKRDRERKWRAGERVRGDG